jgi:hypothetical protein
LWLCGRPYEGPFGDVRGRDRALLRTFEVPDLVYPNLDALISLEIV